MKKKKICLTHIYKEYIIVVFVFKQKTAYEMRISDWSSDVCSSDLALINMSVPTFCRFFKQWTGRTFVNFVQEARIERACELLKATLLPISNICQDSGFHSMAHFIRVFKRLKGLTPHQFREAFS